MIPGAILLLILIGAATVHLTRSRGDRTTKAKWVIPLWGGMSAALVIVPVAVWYVLSVDIYQQCRDRVDRTQPSRDQTIQLYDTIDEATGTEFYTAGQVIPGELSLRDALEQRLPVLDSSECEKP